MTINAVWVARPESSTGVGSACYHGCFSTPFASLRACHPAGFVAAIALWALCVSAYDLHAAAPDGKAPAAKYWAFIGTYTGGASKGIYRLEFDPKTGRLSNPSLAAETASPSFLAVAPSQRFLYAVGETNKFGGKKSGAVDAFALDAKKGALTLLNQQPSGGQGPCHITVDKAGKYVIVANYGGGSVSVLPIEKDGRLGSASAFHQHHGHSVNRQRQEGPHAHCAVLDSANHFAFIADLGLDKILCYRFDPAAGTLTPNDPPSANIAPGSGPRHFAFHPNGKTAYAINEMASTINAFAYDPSHGSLKIIQTISTLPSGYQGDTTTAEIEVHPSGKFLYGSNRGHDSIAVFAIDSATGKLRLVGHQRQGIKTPRHFTIDPTGQWLIVANQDSNSLVVFRIDPQTGELLRTEVRVDVPKPVCVVMVPEQT